MHEHAVENDAGRPSSFVRFDGMTWPNPTDPNDVQWRLRYGQPSKADLLVAASFMHAYAHLIDLPERERNRLVTAVRAMVTPPAEVDA